MLEKEEIRMQTILKKQLNEMTDDELKEILRKDYLRKLIRYKLTDDSYIKKYNMNFERFQKENIVKKQNFNFQTESDAQEWELAIDGIKTVERKLKELSSGN